MRREFKSWECVLLLAAIPLLIWALVAENDHKKGLIKTWCRSHGATLVSAELTSFDTGPYWVKGKNSRIYYVKAEYADGVKTLWFRYAPFSDEVYEELIEALPDGSKYRKIQ